MIDSLISSEFGINVAVDINWKQYWSLRYGTVHKDIETLEYNLNNKQVLDIGQPVRDIDLIMGRFIGLILIKDTSKQIFYDYLNDYSNNVLDQSINEGLLKMYTTDLLYNMIQNNIFIHVVENNGGWLEIDEYKDIAFANQYLKMKK